MLQFGDLCYYCALVFQLSMLRIRQSKIIPMAMVRIKLNTLSERRLNLFFAQNINATTGNPSKRIVIGNHNNLNKPPTAAYLYT